MVNWVASVARIVGIDSDTPRPRFPVPDVRPSESYSYYLARSYYTIQYYLVPNFPGTPHSKIKRKKRFKEIKNKVLKI